MRAKRLVVLAAVMAALATNACAALIGAEDRFFEDDSPGDGGERDSGTVDGASADAEDGGRGDDGPPDPADASSDGDAGTTVPDDGGMVADASPSALYAAAVMSDGPIAWWRMDDPVGSTYAVDAVGARIASVTSSAAIFGVPGAVATAVQLDGNEYLDVGDYFDIVGTQPFTLEAWARPVDWDAGFENLFYKRGDNTDGYALYLRPGEAQFDEYFNPSGGDAFEPVTDETDPVHVVLTFDDADGLTMYVNGVMGQSNFYPSLDAGPAANSAHLELGVQLNGILDEVAIYDKALDITRVVAHYQAGLKAH